MILSRKWLEEREVVFNDRGASFTAQRLAYHDCAMQHYALLEMALLAHDFADAAEGLFRAYDKAIATDCGPIPCYPQYCDKLRELLARMEVKEK